MTFSFGSALLFLALLEAGNLSNRRPLVCSPAGGRHLIRSKRCRHPSPFERSALGLHHTPNRREPAQAPHMAWGRGSNLFDELGGVGWGPPLASPSRIHREALTNLHVTGVGATRSAGAFLFPPVDLIHFESLRAPTGPHLALGKACEHGLLLPRTRYRRRRPAWVTHHLGRPHPFPKSAFERTTGFLLGFPRRRLRRWPRRLLRPTGGARSRARGSRASHFGARLLYRQCPIIRQSILLLHGALRDVLLNFHDYTMQIAKLKNIAGA